MLQLARRALTVAERETCRSQMREGAKFFCYIRYDVLSKKERRKEKHTRVINNNKNIHRNRWPATPLIFNGYVCVFMANDAQRIRLRMRFYAYVRFQCSDQKLCRCMWSSKVNSRQG